MDLVTKYDSNSYLVLSAGDDHGIKGDDINGSSVSQHLVVGFCGSRASMVTMTTEPNVAASERQTAVVSNRATLSLTRQATTQAGSIGN